MTCSTRKRFLGQALSLGALLACIPSNGYSAPEQAQTPSAEQHWSLRPLVLPNVPTPADKASPRTPIDRFILAELEKNQLAPSEPADKPTLIRRVYFDLIGLPPTPEEVESFLRDPVPDAYERVVDRLLASPRHGERWARHWLDVAHYAETHGHDQDRPRTNAWPYRDYVIRSFNEDKPYGRFVEEQVAGDVLWPGDPQAIVALGFLATGPWDESSLRDIQEDTIDRQIARYLDRDDIVMTVMNTFVSATVQCARCHDHKFDPIAQAEYYGLQAVFAATDKANREYDPDPKLHRQRQALLKKKAALARVDSELLAGFRAASFQRELAEWEMTLTNRAIVWTPLDPISFTSSNGATLTKQSDGSLLAGGKRPETDTYAITAVTELKGITAVRLEVLTDESLPHGGPGRQENGNLHLTDFRAFASARALPEPAEGKPVLLQNPSADFNQKDWGIAKAIDADPKTAWGIYPQVGKSHQAVFELAEPLGTDGATLAFVLSQNHGGGHLIGRVRLSVTTAPRPISISSWPDSIIQILATPAARRTDGQRIELAQFYASGEVERKLAALPKPQLVYAGGSAFAPDGSFKPALAPRPIHLLKRGDIHKPGELASAGALACVPGPASRFQLADPENEGLRRAALARWITDPRNTLTWRSIVNRVWHYHFGRGLVDSPNDFGRMGGKPTHPELLDWLAVTFRDNGGSLKSLHRLILTSATWRQASGNAERGMRNAESKAAASQSPPSIDSDNRLLGRMNRLRLEAESIRDAVLQVADKLDLTMGGPSAQQFVLSPGVHVTPVVDYAKFDVDSPASSRRSIYRFIFRTLPDPFMDSLDCADASQLTPARNASVNALQALAMWNDHFIVRQSEHFAGRVARLAQDLEGQITAAYRLALGRPPTPDEMTELAAFTRKHGLANLCRLLFNSNEFMFVN